MKVPHPHPLSPQLIHSSPALRLCSLPRGLLEPAPSSTVLHASSPVIRSGHPTTGLADSASSRRCPLSRRRIPWRSKSSLSMHLSLLNQVQQPPDLCLPAVVAVGSRPLTTGSAFPASGRRMDSHRVPYLRPDRAVFGHLHRRELPLVAPALLVVGVVPLGCAAALGRCRHVVWTLHPSRGHAPLSALCSGLPLLIPVAAIADLYRPLHRSLLG
jgi:hypothetical protein